MDVFFIKIDLCLSFYLLMKMWRKEIINTRSNRATSVTIILIFRKIISRLYIYQNEFYHFLRLSWHDYVSLYA